MIKEKMIIKVGCVAVFFSSPLSTIYANPLEKQREEGVALVRTGNVENGLNLLRNLLEENPKNQKLLADYLTLSYENSTFSQADEKYINNIQIETFPVYAQLSLVKILRDNRKFSEAESYVHSFNRVKQNNNWQVWVAVLQAEAGKNDEAKKSLANLKLTDFNHDYLALVSYAYRTLNMPIEALSTAELSLKKGYSTSGIEQYTLALLQSGDYVKTQEVIKKYNLSEKFPNIIVNAKLKEFTQRIKDAEDFYKSTLILTDSDRAYEKLDQVILEMEQYESQLPNQADLKRHFYYDYMYALELRNRNKQVIDQVKKLDLAEQEMPAYARDVLARAYIKDKQPKKAEALYRSLFKEKNYADFTVYSGLYYALIEQEKFKQADQLIAEMDKALPTFQYSEAKGVDRTTHEQRQEYLTLKGLHYAYRNEHDKAEKYFTDLISKAPNNSAYQHSLALVKLWREQPEKSNDILAQYNGLEGIDQSILINQMQNAQALGNIADWKHKNEFMMEFNPNDTGVIKSKQELDDRNRFSIQHQSLFSKSKSDNPEILNQLKGSKEREHATRINSPWVKNNYRMFVEHDQRWSEYGNRKVEDQNIAIGLEWASNRKLAEVMLTQSLDGDRFGVDAKWSQWLNDHWQYNFGIDTQASIPLQAIKAGREGQSYTAGINWQKNESRKIGSQYQFTDIDDGNERHELGAYFKQRIQQSPHHITNMTLSGYYGKNKDVQVDYFNPKENSSIELKFDHDWVTWRDYDQNFTQHFEASAGSYSQNDYASKAIYNVFYGHDWQLSRTWKLNYGIGWGIHPYDGDDEKRTYGVVGFEGIF
jgi:biofilm PGA synthesis protein PgaA